jgi:hypothetical protein
VKPLGDVEGLSENEWAKRAVVVVHGIGEQRRWTTRDSLIRGLKRCGANSSTPQPESRPFGTPLPPDPLRVARDGVTADVYEVYWAPQTARKTTARSVLWWITDYLIRGDDSSVHSDHQLREMLTSEELNDLRARLDTEFIEGLRDAFWNRQSNYQQQVKSAAGLQARAESTGLLGQYRLKHPACGWYPTKVTLETWMRRASG